MIFEIDHVVEATEQSIKQKIDQNNLQSTLLIVSANDDFASTKYINNKIKFANKFNVDAKVLKTSYNTTTERLKQDLDDLFKVHQTNNKKIDGVIVQLPINPSIDLHQLNKTIDQYNRYGDVDGFGEINVAGLYYNDKKYNDGFLNVPCTAQGCFDIISSYFNKNVAGKNVVIINRSNIVGKPLALLCLHNDMTVMVAHSKTTSRDLFNAIKNADVIVTAVGKQNFINPREFLFKKNCLIVDVSINRDQQGKVCGDVDKQMYLMENVYCTKVPGGVGRLTVANLINNVVNSALKSKDESNESKD